MSRSNRRALINSLSFTICHGSCPGIDGVPTKWDTTIIESRSNPYKMVYQLKNYIAVDQNGTPNLVHQKRTCAALVNISYYQAPYTFRGEVLHAMYQSQYVPSIYLQVKTLKVVEGGLAHVMNQSQYVPSIYLQVKTLVAYHQKLCFRACTTNLWCKILFLGQSPIKIVIQLKVL